MTRLFGIPMGVMETVLLVTLALTLGFVATLALRNRIFFRLGIRNARRRPGRSALIVVGLMLGTAIITASLATGDTMTRTVRSSAVKSLGQTDELVAARGATPDIQAAVGAATGVRYFPQADVATVKRALAGSNLVDGVAPAIVEPVGVQDVTSRQNEPAVTIFASTARDMRGFGPITLIGGGETSLAALAPGWVYLNRDAADSLGASPGDSIRIFAASAPAPMRVARLRAASGATVAANAITRPLCAK